MNAQCTNDKTAARSDRLLEVTSSSAYERVYTVLTLMDPLLEMRTVSRENLEEETRAPASLDLEYDRSESDVPFLPTLSPHFPSP